VFLVRLTWSCIVTFFCISWQVFPHHTQSYRDLLITLRYNIIQSNIIRYSSITSSEKKL
jgi:hypothetical protein